MNSIKCVLNLLLLMIVNKVYVSSECENFYKLFPGDSCADIAGAYRITQEELENLNPELDCKKMPIGEKICVPMPKRKTREVSKPCENFYKIFPGDSCIDIAGAYHISQEELENLNPELNCKKIPIGEKICVPIPKRKTRQISGTCQNFYKIFSGDSCTDIAAAYRITESTLVSLNPGLNCANLIIGTTICVPVVGSGSGSTGTCTNYYTVFSGDTCDNIAAAYKTTTATLLQLNPGLNCLSIPVGTRICVPNISSGGVSSCLNYYTVYSGDTCENIAAAFRITSSSLVLLNPGLNCITLPIGARLCVSGSFPSTTISTTTCSNYYTIFSGDSCTDIAAAYKITTSALIQLNPGLNCLSLPIGQRICVPVVSSSVTVSPVTCSNYYTIFTGDSCDNIASAYKITTAALLQLNPGLNCLNIPVGQRICVPNVSSGSGGTTTCTNYYTIFSGDTCDNIAAAYKITTAALLQLNPGLNCLNIPVGQRICVPNVSSGGTTTSCTNYYTVYSGDTCDNIAAIFRITTSTLLQLNPGLNCLSTLAGQRVCVASSSIVNPSTCTNYYTIFSGDTCDNIAAAYKITTAALLQLNPGLNCLNIPVGQRICVPNVSSGSSGTSSCANYYTIFSGDSCADIAAAFKTTTIALLQLNPGLNCLNIPVGQRICVLSTTPSSATCSNYYTIYPGDTCQILVTQFSTTLSALTYLNPTLNCNNLLLAGTQICVPPTISTSVASICPTYFIISNGQLICASSISSVTTAAPTKCSSYYQIASSDTCTSIASKYGIELFTFYSLNQAINCQNLQVGQLVCLTGTTTSCSLNYVIQSGDSCYSLSIKYGLSLSTLSSKVNCNNLQVGLTIC